MRMTDYQVNYTNHPNYKAKAPGKKGSPVRLFTNVSLAHVKLPAGDGYRFCKPCQRYSSASNQHCKVCKVCPSKDGSAWVHCKHCRTCVKPGRVHCHRCKHCLPAVHDCEENARVRSIGCHLCGSTEHRRADCPTRS